MDLKGRKGSLSLTSLSASHMAFLWKNKDVGRP